VWSAVANIEKCIARQGTDARRKAKMPAITAPINKPAQNSRMREAIPHLVLGWVLMFPLIFFAAGGNFSFQTAGNNNALGGTALARLAGNGRNLGFVGYVVLPGIAYSIVLWVILKNLHRIKMEALQMKAITLLALLTICSALWSQNPFRSLYNGFFYFISTLFGFYLVVQFEPDEIVSLAMMAGVSLSVLNLIFVFLLPQFGVLHQLREAGAWAGVFMERTAAAKCMVFLLSPAFVFERGSFRLGRIGYIILLGWFIFKTHAVTALIVLFFYILVMAAIYILRKFETKSLIVISGIALILGVVVVSVSLPFLPAILTFFGRDSTLTGRTFIWQVVIRSIVKRPLLGYGFYAFWQGLTGESANAILSVKWIFGYAHNGILELLLQLGVVGTAVFFITLFQALKNAWLCIRNNQPSAADWYIGLIALTILYNVDEATVVWPNDLLSILYVVACCGLAKAAREIREPKGRCQPVIENA
jgi:exopolysaccharide production protein ExoQ